MALLALPQAGYTTSKRRSESSRYTLQPSFTAKGAHAAYAMPDERFYLFRLEHLGLRLEFGLELLIVDACIAGSHDERHLPVHMRTKASWRCAPARSPLRRRPAPRWRSTRRIPTPGPPCPARGRTPSPFRSPCLSVPFASLERAGLFAPHDRAHAWRCSTVRPAALHGANALHSPRTTSICLSSRSALHVSRISDECDHPTTERLRTSPLRRVAAFALCWIEKPAPMPRYANGASIGRT